VLYFKIVTPIHIVSYPKSGRTWLRLLIASAIAPSVLIEQKLKTLEFSFFKKNICFSHKYYQQVNLIGSYRFAGRKNIILVVRDPRDIIVSSYHEHTKRSVEIDEQITISDFCRNDVYGIDKIVAFYNNYYDSYKEDIVSIVKYEDLHKNTSGVLIKVLGLIYPNKRFSERTISNAVNECNFSRLQKEAKLSSEKVLAPASDLDKNSQKFRNGKRPFHVCNFNNLEYN
jgi:hypothetical protein